MHKTYTRLSERNWKLIEISYKPDEEFNRVLREEVEKAKESTAVLVKPRTFREEFIFLVLVPLSLILIGLAFFIETPVYTQMMTTSVNTYQ